MGQLKRIQVNKGNGGIGGVTEGIDHIVGFVYDLTTLPTALTGYDGFDSNNRIKKILSIQDAINYGINDSHSDETKATGGSYEVTTAGAAGETWYLYVTPLKGYKTLLGSYTVKSGDDAAAVATGLVAAVNLKTNEHGFAATLSTATVVLTAPSKMGASLNTTATILTKEVYDSTGAAGTGAATTTQFTGGAGSKIAPLYYHLEQAFTYNPSVVIYLGLYDLSTFDATKIESVQNYAQGECTKMVVFTDTTYASSMITGLQTSTETLNSAGRPTNVVLVANISATTASALVSLRSLISQTKKAAVGMSIGQDITGEGYRLSGVLGHSIGDCGAIIGIWSRAKVMQNIGAVEFFDITQGTEYNKAGLATGEKVADLSDNLVTQLDNYGYIFQVNYDGIAGTYFNDSWTATSLVNDYNSLERNTTMDKAERLVRIALLPLINSNIYVSPSTGLMRASDVAKIKVTALTPLEQMAKDGEISTEDDGTLPEGTVFVDPNRNILSTSEVIVTISIVPVSVGRKFTVNLKFVKQL